jgi:hypothetical protein
MVKKFIVWINNNYIGIIIKNNGDVKIFCLLKNIYIMNVIINDYFKYTEYLKIQQGGNKYKCFYTFNFNGNLDNVLRRFNKENIIYEKVSSFNRLLY